MTDDLGGRMRTIRFSPATEAALAEMEAIQRISQAEVIREALNLHLWMLRERAQGSRFLVQRGDVVTEFRLSDPGEDKPSS